MPSLVIFVGTDIYLNQKARGELESATFWFRYISVPTNITRLGINIYLNQKARGELESATFCLIKGTCTAWPPCHKSIEN